MFDWDAYDAWEAWERFMASARFKFNAKTVAERLKGMLVALPPVQILRAVKRWIHDKDCDNNLLRESLNRNTVLVLA